jgi:hypothetical protein
MCKSAAGARTGQAATTNGGLTHLSLWSLSRSVIGCMWHVAKRKQVTELFKVRLYFSEIFPSCVKLVRSKQPQKPPT